MMKKIESKKETAKKLTGGELLELINSDFLLSLLDLLHVNFSFIDPQGNYMVQNNTITQELIENKTKAQEIDMDSWLDCEKTMHLGQRRIVEEQYKGKYLFSIKQPVIVNGECQGIVIMSLDITQRKLIEKREQAALALAEEQKAKTEAEEMLRRSISIFAGSIAHDLKVPLTSMLIMTDLFNRSLNQLIKQSVLNIDAQLEDETQLHLEYINEFPNKLKKSVVEMNSFINLTLRAMQRLATNTLSYEDFSICEIEKCLHDVLDRYPFIKLQKELIEVYIEHNFAFLACPILFYRILFNLINNALSQIERNNRGKIYISTVSTNTHNILRIKDTAGGVPPERLSSLFEGYRSTKKKGTGVGLAFCKLTMESFGGNIICHSIEGDYIEFELMFPKLDEMK